MAPTPFLNDALVRSVLTRKLAALETSTQRNPSQPQVSQLNDLTQTYHGILATSGMQPKTALGVLSKIAPPEEDLKDWGLAFQLAAAKRHQQYSTLSNIMKSFSDTSASLVQNLK
jgi:hypothetical protein